MFTKSDLKDGDIVTLKNENQRTLKGNRFIDEYGTIASGLEYYNNELRQQEYSNLDIIKVERPVQYETVFERKEEILDKAEKRYLRDVIRPFRNKIDHIVKSNVCKKEFIYIELENKENINFPFFEEKTMYKGMKLDKEYTLEELRTIKE